MNVEELKEVFRSAGILVIPIIDSTDPDDCEGLQFDGELSEYTKTVTSLGIKTVFVAVDFLSDDIFEQDITIQNDDGDDTFPIINVYPEIESYRDKIGKARSYKVMAKGNNFDLNLFISEDWWTQLTQNVRNACRTFEEKMSIEEQILQRNFNAKKSKIVKQINSLVTDNRFIKLRTQGAMAAYAQENIEGLNSILEESELKKEIQKVNDLLVARGLK